MSLHSYLKIRERGAGKKRGFKLTIDSQRTNIKCVGGGGVDLPCIKVRKLGFVKDKKRKIKKERDWVKAKYRERNRKNGY